MTDDRIICIAGKVKIGEKVVSLNLALKFDKEVIAEEIYEAIKGLDYEHGLKLLGVIHDGCLTEDK